MRRETTLPALLAALLFLGACSGPRAGTDVAAPPLDATTVRFAAVGDMPYSSREDSMLTAPDGEIVAALRAAPPPVLIHFGDLKSGGSACTDSLLIRQREQVFALNPFRTVYTPGDNDWTDCDRESMSPRFDELERLAFVRSQFYHGEGARLARDVPGLIRQPGVVENAMWTMGGLVLGTLHVPGTNNGRAEILMSDVAAALAEADRRDAANEAWIDSLFAAAASADALVLAFQADIYHPDVGKPNRPCSAEHRVDCDGFKRIRDHIEQKAASYQKPVLLIHGDTNAYCFHKPAAGLAPNLWRLNAPGDFKLSDAAQITFNPAHSDRPFEVATLLGSAPLPELCDYSR